MPFPQPGTGGIDQLTGDVTAGPGTGSQAAALADVGTAGTVGDATHYPVITTDAKGRITAATPTAVPPGVSPATTVTGPDAFGAAAVVGTSALYAREDHDHGLPAAPAGALSYAIGGPAAAAIPTTLTTVLTTASLAVGVWKLDVSFNYRLGSSAPATANFDFNLVVGTATATFMPSTFDTYGAGPGVGTSQYAAFTVVPVLVNVTVAGTIAIQAVGSNLGTSAGFSCYYTAIKIA